MNTQTLVKFFDLDKTRLPIQIPVGPNPWGKAALLTRAGPSFLRGTVLNTAGFFVLSAGLDSSSPILLTMGAVLILGAAIAFLPLPSAILWDGL